MLKKTHTIAWKVGSFNKSLQAVSNNVNKRRYVTSKARVALQCYIWINLDLSNPISKIDDDTIDRDCFPSLSGAINFVVAKLR